MLWLKFWNFWKLLANKQLKMSISDSLDNLPGAIALILNGCSIILSLALMISRRKKRNFGNFYFFQLISITVQICRFTFSSTRFPMIGDLSLDFHVSIILAISIQFGIILSTHFFGDGWKNHRDTDQICQALFYRDILNDHIDWYTSVVYSR